VKAPLIDSSQLLKAGWRRRAYAPFQGLAEDLLGLRRINQLYGRIGGRGLDAAEFCQAGLEDLGVQWSMAAADRERLGAVQGPCVVMANHPLGGREAMALHCILAQARPDYRILSNFILGQVPEVKPRLILVDPFETGQSARANVGPLRECLQWLGRGGLLGLFPAGEVSYWQPEEGRIADKAWAGQALRLALKAKATILPLHFSGSNSALFNTVARMKPAWKLPWLPRQLAFGPSTRLQATLGQPLPFDALPYRDQPPRLAAWLREQVYALATAGQGAPKEGYPVDRLD
jgi:putative hemolysin